MKIKEVSAGVKVSRNYDSYQVGFVAEVGDGEDCGEVGRALMKRALGVVEGEISCDGKKSFDDRDEIGAAWKSRKIDNCFSVKIDGKWIDVRIEDLVKSGDGYEWRVGDEVFDFRRVEGRTEKMPSYRIYRK
jgi:hypothetical protein